VIIEIGLFASLAPHKSHPRINADGTMELPSPMTVGEVVDALGIARHDIRLVFINGAHARMDSMVNDGDRLGLFPPIGGG
jgi:sulfur carrier protein ThiS